jgi:beta-glucosidase
MTQVVLPLFITAVVLAGNLLASGRTGQGQTGKTQAIKQAWMDKSLSADQRADLLIEQMTLDEKITLVHGLEGPKANQESLGGEGYVPGIPRLGVPALQMTDGRSGVANIGSRGRYATALPSSLANAATWDLDVAYEYRALLGKEVRELGFNVSLGGTANIIREPRNGRNFECLGEDPILIGKMLGRELRGTQDQMVHRILRTEFALGVVDNPPDERPVNPFAGAEVAQRVAERGIVLLKNSSAQLPLDASVKSIAVIGSHADTGVPSGAGSDQVDAAGAKVGGWEGIVWQPSSPLKAIQCKTSNAHVVFDSGTVHAAAASVASAAEVAIVFVWQHTTEGRDVASLSLPDNQDDLISRVAAANPRTIVVLESGGPVTMPWFDHASGILEAWYPGIRGGEAIANILFGEVNPSGKLPVSFPKSEAELPRRRVPGMSADASEDHRRSDQTTPFDIDYSEGLKVGYKWYESEGKQPLFPFGFGLSYTSFSYSQLNTASGDGLKVSFDVANTGTRAGDEVAQVYVRLPESTGEPFKRLVGWQKVQLSPGETKGVNLTLDSHFLSVFDASKEVWKLVPGDYKVYVGGSSDVSSP